jgi:hypothetical protein
VKISSFPMPIDKRELIKRAILPRRGAKLKKER